MEIVSAIPNQKTTPPAQKETPAPKPRFISVLIGILLLALFGVGGFLLGRQSAQPKSTLTTAQITSMPSENPKHEEETLEIPTATPTPNPTADWETYENNDFSFKYPQSWTVESHRITGTNPNVIISIVGKDSTLMNECMKLYETKRNNNLVIKKFSRVATGEMCATNDSSQREIWIIPSEESYSPGISYTYSTKDNPEAEEIFNLLLSTFKFD